MVQHVLMRRDSVSSLGRYNDHIQREVDAYKAAFTWPDPAWSVDVRVLLAGLNKRLFEVGLTIGELERQSGLLDHNVASRFASCVGRTPKAYRLAHQVALAKRLLQHEGLKEAPIYQLALAIGYGRHGDFSRMFKERVGCTPSQYRARVS